MEISTNIPLCDGCGLEAYRDSQTCAVIPLLRCSRCQKAFYHDRACQKQHYREHRKFCCPLTKTNPLPRGPTWEIRELPGRGKGVTATQMIPSHETIGPAFHPMVLPVLLDSCRKEYCVCCFRRISQVGVFAKLWNHSVCPVVVCSVQCQNALETCYSFRKELDCLEKLYDSPGGSPPVLLHAALLIFRIYLALSEKKLSQHDIDSMLYHRDDTSAPDALHHQYAVQITVDALWSTFGRSSPRDVATMVQRMKYNAFTIVNEYDEPIGFGLYRSPAHYLNHSCRPNTLQRFTFGLSTPPLLEIRVGADPILAGDEICIAYQQQTHDAPRDARRNYLHKMYNFWCDCELCQIQKPQKFNSKAC